MSWLIFTTKLGPCGIAWNDAGVTRIQLPEATRDETITRLLARAPNAGDRATRATTPTWVDDAVARIREHVGGKPQDLTRVRLDLSRLTALTTKIYRAAQSVPAGKTASYGDLAAAVGSPRASRAVGRAMATNPFPIVVPCHRVVGASGRAGGFSAYGGLVTKEKILAAEGATLTTRRSLFHGTAPLPFDTKEAARHLAEADPVLAAHMEKIGPLGLELMNTESTFAALAESIVYQQLTGKAAGTIFGRVRALYRGGRLDPRRVLETPEVDLRAAGLSRAKHASLKDLAERTVRGDIPSLAELSRLDDEAIVERLTMVRGVGRWTVEMLLIFRLGRPDILPVADYGIKKGFANLFGKRRSETLPTPTELTRRAERWRPFRSAASWYLWRAAEVRKVP